MGVCEQCGERLSENYLVFTPWGAFCEACLDNPQGEEWTVRCAVCGQLEHAVIAEEAEDGRHFCRHHWGWE